MTYLGSETRDGEFAFFEGDNGVLISKWGVKVEGKIEGGIEEKGVFEGMGIEGG